MAGFSGVLGTGRSEDDLMIIKFDDYWVSSKIRQYFLHWGYELTEEDFFNELKNYRIQMSYY